MNLKLNKDDLNPNFFIILTAEFNFRSTKKRSKWMLAIVAYSFLDEKGMANALHFISYISLRFLTR